MPRAATPALSVVIPVYNEEEVMPLLAQRLRPILDGLGDAYEVIAVDDGSKDATPVVLAAMRRNWPELRIIRLQRNSGHQAALTAGLTRAFGDYVVSIDADLQDPPEKIAEMLAMARGEQLDIVYGVRADRTTDTFLKRTTAGLYYRLMRKIADADVPSQAGDFRLLSRAAVDALKAMPEHRPVYRLLVPWLNFPSGTVSFAREERAAGRTKYPLSKMLRLAADSVTNFSAAPLRLASWLGLASFAACFLVVVATVAVFLADYTVPGWSSLIIAITFLGGVQLVCLGLLGEYVGRIYASVQNRPAYLIAADSAFDPTGQPAPVPPVRTPAGHA